jgi:hypothetical protein
MARSRCLSGGREAEEFRGYGKQVGSESTVLELGPKQWDFEHHLVRQSTSMIVLAHSLSVIVQTHGLIHTFPGRRGSNDGNITRSQTRGTRIM